MPAVCARSVSWRACPTSHLLRAELERAKAQPPFPVASWRSSSAVSTLAADARHYGHPADTLLWLYPTLPALPSVESAVNIAEGPPCFCWLEGLTWSGCIGSRVQYAVFDGWAFRGASGGALAVGAVPLSPYVLTENQSRPGCARAGYRKGMGGTGQLCLGIPQ